MVVVGLDPDGEKGNRMNSFIYETLVDVERRLQELLADVTSLKEQVFYTYDPADTGEDNIPE